MSRVSECIRIRQKAKITTITSDFLSFYRRKDGNFSIRVLFRRYFIKDQFENKIEVFFNKRSFKIQTQVFVSSFP